MSINVGILLVSGLVVSVGSYYHTLLDFVFLARLYSSDSVEIEEDTSGGNLIHIPDFVQNLGSRLKSILMVSCSVIQWYDY